MGESGGEEWEWLVCSASRPGQGLKNGTTTRRQLDGTQERGHCKTMDSMCACWGTVETSTLSWQIGPQGPP